MPRRLSQRFVCQPLADLSRQLLFAPPEKRRDQVLQAERLHDQIDPSANYPLDFVKYRITGHRSETQRTTVLPAEAILPDLRLMIDVLSRSVDVPIQPSDPVETSEQVAKRLHVSTKTITRWRKSGLRWRWSVIPGTNRKQIVIPRTGLKPFLCTHEARVARASQFTHLEPDLRERLIQRACRIAQVRDVTPHQVAQHLARRVGRATQTVRSALEQHDQEHPGAKIFLDRTEPLTQRQKRVISRAHHLGVSVDKICQRFRRSRSTILRVLRDQRATSLRRLQIVYVASPTFIREDADEVILRPEIDTVQSAPPAESAASPVADLPEVLQPLFHQPMFDDEHMLSQLIRLNYLKFKAATGRDQLDKYEPRVTEMKQIEQCLHQASTLRDRLVAANLPLVLSVASRHLVDLPGSGAVLLQLNELLEMAVSVLIEAIDSFDLNRKQTFASYLTWHLMRQFAKASLERSDSLPHGSRAHRRDPTRQVLERMCEIATDFGVKLPADLQE